jgi:hypothetical protein
VAPVCAAAGVGLNTHAGTADAPAALGPAAARSAGTPAAATRPRGPSRRFDTAQPYAAFSGDASDYDWAGIQAAWEDDTWVAGDVRDHERRVIAARRQPAFTARLQELLDLHPTLPLVRSGLRLHQWLDALAEDPEAEAAAFYFSLSRGFFLLPLDAAHPRSWGKNYGSCHAAAAEVDAEFARLLSKGVIGKWADVAREAGLGHLDRPTTVLSLGVVLKRGKTRIVIDASAPHGASLNDAAELPRCRLANITMAMRAMSRGGRFWLADLEDAFHQSPLAMDSLRYSCVCWRGVLYCYRRSFFGFAPAPAQQQAQAVALCRITTRRLRRLGLPCGDPPGWDQCWSSAHPDVPTVEQRGERAEEQAVAAGPWAYNRPAASGEDSLTTLLAYLDDFWGCCAGRPEAASFVFLHFLSVCESLGVRVKTAKCSPPTIEGLFLGVWLSLTDMTVSIGVDRVAELSDRLRRLLAQPTVTVQDLMSVVGVLVFCSIVIPAARCFYRRLLDALRTHNGRHHRHLRLRWTTGMREDVSVWLSVLERYSSRPVSRGVSDPIFEHAGYSDAAFAGYGWHLAGTTLFDRGAWPATWADRIGMHSEFADIYIVELELWAALFMLRAIIPLVGGAGGAGGRLRIFNDNQSVCGMLAKLTTSSRRCLPLIKEVVGLLVVFGVTLVVSWLDSASNRHADLLSRWSDPAEDKAALLRELRELQAASSRRSMGPADRQRPLRPDLADLFPAAVMDEYSAATEISASEAAAIASKGWTVSPLE